jgi:hypothetical protein
MSGGRTPGSLENENWPFGLKSLYTYAIMHFPMHLVYRHHVDSLLNQERKPLS